MLKFTKLLPRYYSSPRDANRIPAIGGADSITGAFEAPTLFSLTGANAMATAIVDGSGNQITSFGGGTQYTDAGTPPAHPVGGTLLWNNSGTWATVSAAAPLPVSATLQTQTDTIMVGGFNVKEINGVVPSMGVGASGTGTSRVVQANDAGKTLVSAGGSASSSGNNTLVGAGTNKLKVYAFSLSTTSATAVTCIFQSGAGGTELWRVILQAPTSVSTGANLVIPPPAYIFATATNTLLNLNLSGAQTVHWAVSYWDEA